MQLNLVCIFGVAACVLGQVSGVEHVNQPLAPLEASETRLRGPSAEADASGIGSGLLDADLILTAGIEVNANILLGSICGCKQGSQADLLVLLKATLGLVVDISVDLTTVIRASVSAILNVVVTVGDLIKAKFGVVADLTAFVEGVLGLSIGIGVDINTLCQVPVVVKDGVSTCATSTTTTTPRPTCGCT